MKQQHEELLKDVLPTNGDTKRVLFYDPVEKKRVDLALFLIPEDDEIVIAGDEGEIYLLSELELIDDEILKNYGK